MSVAFVTPSSALHASPLYRFAHMVYEPSNAISGPLILGRILADAGYTVDVYEELYTNLPFKKILIAIALGFRHVWFLIFVDITASKDASLITPLSMEVQDG